jgi:hypothetical protein
MCGHRLRKAADMQSGIAPCRKRIRTLLKIRKRSSGVLGRPETGASVRREGVPYGHAMGLDGGHFAPPSWVAEDAALGTSASAAAAAAAATSGETSGRPSRLLGGSSQHREASPSSNSRTAPSLSGPRRSTGFRRLVTAASSSTSRTGAACQPGTRSTTRCPPRLPFSPKRSQMFFTLTSVIAERATSPRAV